MKIGTRCSQTESGPAGGRPGPPLGTPAGNAQFSKAPLEIVFRASHKTGCQSLEVSVVFKSISLHYLAVFRQILMTILPSYLFRAPSCRAFDFLLGEYSVLGWVRRVRHRVPSGVLWGRIRPRV